MVNIIDRNTPIPCSKSKNVTTHEDNQQDADIYIYTGERHKAKKNKLLGIFNIEGIPPAKWGVPRFKITCKVDVNGILSATVKDKFTGKTTPIKIMNDYRLHQRVVKEMTNDAES